MSVKLYTPDDNVIVHETKVDFRRRVVQRQVNLVQYDKSMPVIAVQLCSNGNEYVLPENASAYIRFGKRDHTYVYNECLGCDQTRTIVYFAITDQMTVFYGEHTPIVELRIGDTVAGSGSIPIWIDRNPIQNGDTESKSDLSVFEKAIEAAQKINVKLPTDLKASASNLCLLAGDTKIGSGINLSGFEYDEATKTLKASGGGGASVSPCLNLINMENTSVRTSITEEEKTNLENGLYNSVLYADFSKGEEGFYSIYFPEPIIYLDGTIVFSIYDASANEATQSMSIMGSSIYSLEIGEPNEDKSYPITINKIIIGSFGGGGGSSTPSTSTSIAFQDITVSELANHVGEFGNFHITDLKLVYDSFLGPQEFTGGYFIGTVAFTTELAGVMWVVVDTQSNQTAYYKSDNFSINNGKITLQQTETLGVIKSLPFPKKINSQDGYNFLSEVIDTGSIVYAGEADIDSSSISHLILGLSSSVVPTATGDEEYCHFDCIVEEKGIGRLSLKKDASNIPQFKSFTTWLPPITAADEGKSLVVKNGNGQWATSEAGTSVTIRRW